MSILTIRPVASSSDEMRFIKAQWLFYEGNPHWVPPLILDRKKLIDRRKNPFYKHARMELFLAERMGKVVGRIGAIVNDNHNREHRENIGFFGFFECVNEQPVADALFDAAAAWLTNQGVTAVRGPANPSVNDEYGLLVEGFDRSPMIMMPYNPPYYASLIEGYGFRKVKDLYAYQVVRESFLSEKLARVSRIVREREGLVIRTLNMRKFPDEVRTIRELYARGWERNWGEVPMTEEEFNYAAGDMKAIVDPDLVIIAEIKGKPVGFGLTLPDINQVLIRNRKGRLVPGLIRLLLQKKRINQVRIIILGVLPEYLNSGIGGLLFVETGTRAVAKGYYTGEASWVLEDNVMMNRGAQLMNGVITKRYRLFQKPLP
jgi:GNAT superfamily N-acetyltransferase